MADHRNPIRPRHLGFAVALVLMCAAASAKAQEAGLKNGTAALNAGNYDNAVRLLTSTVNSEGAPSGEAAKALYLRGIAYRKLGQPSRAIADLGAAIWLGLPGSDRVRAQVNRGLAFRSAGLTSEAEADFSAARRASSSSEVEKIIAEDSAGTAVAVSSAQVSPEGESLSDRVRNAIPSFGGTETRTATTAPTAQPETPGAWSTSVSQGAAPQESGSRVSRWWGSVTDTFSSSDEPAGQPAPAPAAAPSPSPSPAPSPAAAPTRTAAAPAAPQAAAPSSWTTEVQDANAGGGEGGTRLGRWISRNTGGDSEPAAAPAQTAATSGGGYRLQLANSRSEAEAKALWQQAAGKSQQLASVRPQIEQVDIGNFGTFYSLRAGPFDRAESQSVCNSLKRGGIDCSVVTPDGP